MVSIWSPISSVYVTYSMCVRNPVERFLGCCVFRENSGDMVLGTYEEKGENWGTQEIGENSGTFFLEIHSTLFLFNVLF